MLNLVGVESEVHVCCVGNLTSVNRRSLVDAVLAEVHKQYGQKDDGADGARAFGLCEFLTNGARCYNDHNYVEYSTPALSDTADAVAAIRAGDRIVRTAVESVQTSLNDKAKLLAVRNNTDFRGHSYAAHVNIRVSREGFERIFNDTRLFHGMVVPFFATLPLICGAGRAGGDNGQNTFYVWQRGAFIETLVGEATQTNRPLVNTRDESLSADPEYARLHVIHLDANRAEVAEYCKLGLLKLFGAAVDYAGWNSTSFELDDPLCAVRSITGFPFNPLRLKSKQTATPLAIQRHFFECFERLHERGAYADRVPDARDILKQVDKVLTALERDPFELVGSLDWITKFVWLEQFRTRNGLNWSDPRMQWADIQYHSLTHPNDSELPTLRRITSESQVQSLIDDAPNGSRARIRGTILRKFGSELGDIDWHWIVERDGLKAYSLPDDPVDGILESAEHAKTLNEFVRLLGLVPIPVTPMLVVQLADRKEARQETAFTHSQIFEEVKNA